MDPQAQEPFDDIEPKYRTFWRRFWASFIDGFVFWPLGLIDDSVYSHDVSPTLRVGWFFFYSLLPYAYRVGMHSHFGQTLGKMATRVKVLDLSETKLRFQQALLRDSVPILIEVVGCILGLSVVLQGWSPTNAFSNPFTWSAAKKLHMLAWVVWLFAEVLILLTNDKRRAVHDLIAGSVVVRTRVPV